MKSITSYSETEIMAARAEMQVASDAVSNDPAALLKRLDRLKQLVRQEELPEGLAREIARTIRTLAANEEEA